MFNNQKSMEAVVNKMAIFHKNRLQGGHKVGSVADLKHEVKCSYCGHAFFAKSINLTDKMVCKDVPEKCDFKLTGRLSDD